MIFEGNKKSIFFGLELTRAGKGMPELALIVPLCHILQISINEFLSGEHLLENGYTEKAEVNMMNLLQETENSKKKSRSSLLAFGITVTIFYSLFYILLLPIWESV